MLEPIDEDRLEDLHDLAIANAKLIQQLFDRVAFLERQIPRNVFGYTEEQANAIDRLFHISGGKDPETWRYTPWHFSDSLDEYRTIVRKVRQIEYAMPLEQKAAFPDLNTNPHSEDVKDDFTGL